MTDTPNHTTDPIMAAYRRGFSMALEAAAAELLPGGLLANLPPMTPTEVAAHLQRMATHFTLDPKE